MDKKEIQLIIKILGGVLTTVLTLFGYYQFLVYLDQSIENFNFFLGVLITTIVIFFIIIICLIIANRKKLKQINNIESSRANKSSDYKIYGSESDTKDSITDFIRTHSITDAYMIEYSAKHAGNVLDELSKKSSMNIHLLINSPTHFLNEDQVIRVREGISTISTKFKNSTLNAQHINLSLKGYTNTSSLRGRLFIFEEDGVQKVKAFIGWYTYEIDPEISETIQVHGQNNCMIETPIETIEKSNIYKMYMRVFNNTWKSSSEEIKVAFDKKYPNATRKPTDEWFAAVKSK